VAGRPLRPATDHRLGEPSPHQPANRPQAPPQARSEDPFPRSPQQGPSTCGITLRFRRLPPTSGQIAHAFLTRPPRRGPEGLRVRLACIRHAASVDPEPGSNSPPNSALLSAPRPPPRRARARAAHYRSGRPLPGRRPAASPHPHAPRPPKGPAAPRMRAHSVFHGPASGSAPLSRCYAAISPNVLSSFEKRTAPIARNGAPRVRQTLMGSVTSIVFDDLQGHALSLLRRSLGAVFASRPPLFSGSRVNIHGSPETVKGKPGRFWRNFDIRVRPSRRAPVSP
jgi:hypothetical protein